MYTEQIQQYHSELNKRRIKGDIENNELVYCMGKVKVRVLINSKWQSVEMNPNTDNKLAINKLNKIIDKQVNNASKTTDIKQEDAAN